jgi:tRNA pseudouridine38-40 synthase
MNYLKKGAKILEGTHNFSTFRAASCSAKSPIKTMNSIKIKKKSDKIFIRFSSKSFLQNQVRSMVGCLEKVASKKWNLLKFKKIFKSGKRNLCAPPAPACGLYLMNVSY